MRLFIAIGIYLFITGVVSSIIGPAIYSFAIQPVNWKVYCDACSKHVTLKDHPRWFHDKESAYRIWASSTLGALVGLLWPLTIPALIFAYPVIHRHNRITSLTQRENKVAELEKELNIT